MRRRLLRQPAAADDPAPPIASLIDVAFLMLIFFLVTSTLLKREQDLALNVPAGAGPAPQATLPVEIAIDDHGAVEVGAHRRLEPVEPAGTGRIGDALRQRLAPAVAAAAPDPLPVVLDVSDAAAQQRVVSVLDTLAGLGIRQILLRER